MKKVHTKYTNNAQKNLNSEETKKAIPLLDKQPIYETYFVQREIWWLCSNVLITIL